MKEFFKGFAASAAQVGAACVAKWAVVGAVSFFCPPLRAAVSSAITAYSVGMTAYSVGKCAYDNYDTLQEIGNAALAGDLGQIAAWGIDAVCSMSYEQLGSLAFDAVSIAALMARVKGAKAASVAEKVEKAAKSTPVVKPVAPSGGRSNGFLGKRGWELENFSYQPIRNRSININGLSYSAHAIDQMQNRGLVPMVIEDAIRNGDMYKGKIPGTLMYFNFINKISVITDVDTGPGQFHEKYLIH